MMRAMLPILLAVVLGVSAPAPAAGPVRLQGEAFGFPVTVEARSGDPETARAALEAALAEIAAIERLADPAPGSGEIPDGSVAVLNAAAGLGPRAVDSRLMPLLARARDFCVWNEGAHGPLGGELYELWGLRAPAAGLPTPSALKQATERADCSKETIRLDVPTGMVNLVAGTRLDFWGFAEGHAVDRAVEVLKERGIGNGFVQIGGTCRGFGLGPAGKGWPVDLPVFPGQREPLGAIYLRDQSLGIAARTDPPLQVADASLPPYVNQRTGRPAAGVLAAFAVTELGVDARGLAVTVLITGSREGRLRLGSIRPEPSVLWLLGNGQGVPLIVRHDWSRVHRR